MNILCENEFVTIFSSVFNCVFLAMGLLLDFGEKLYENSLFFLLRIRIDLYLLADVYPVHYVLDTHQQEERILY